MKENQKKETKLLIENAAQMLTMRGESNHDVGLIESGWLYMEGDKIRAVGSKEEVERAAGDLSEVERIDATGKVVGALRGLGFHFVRYGM